MESIEKISTSKCPLCRKSLANNEYKQAISQLEEKLQENFDKQNKSQKELYEQKLESEKNYYDNAIKNSHEIHQEQLTTLKDSMDNSYKKQLDMLKENYELMLKENKKQFEEIENKLNENFKNKVKEKEKEIKDLESCQRKFKKDAIQQAQFTFEKKYRELEQKIGEKDIQLQRASDEMDHLKKQLIQNQSELKGEVGELNLLSALNEAFSDDRFRRQKRGVSSGDIIQEIRINGKNIDTLIIYDNKSSNTVTKKDIEKAKKYQKIHDTNYVLIVSEKLPKISVPNGLYGTRDGIILVHPKIVTEVAKQIRTSIIEVSKHSLGKEDLKSKQSKLYEFVMSNEFAIIVNELTQTDQELYKLQSKEERDHNTMWKIRKELCSKLTEAHNNLASTIEYITQSGISDLKEKEKLV